MADDEIHDLDLHRNENGNFHVNIPILDFNEDDQVVALARALRENQYVSECTISLQRPESDGPIRDLDWNPLFGVLRSWVGLEEVRIWDTGAHHLNRNLQFGNRLFRELQQNANLERLHMIALSFSKDSSDRIVSFLDNSPALKYVAFEFCPTDDEGGLAVAAALARNKRIELGGFDACNASLLCPLLESMTYSGGLSSMSHFAYGPGDRSVDFPRPTAAEQDSILKSMRKYLESSTATMRFLQLDHVPFRRGQGVKDLTEGLRQNTSVRRLKLYECTCIDDEGEQMLAAVIRRNPNLETVRIKDPNGFLLENSVMGAVCANLTWRDTPLRCLDICGALDSDEFKLLAEALKNRDPLEHLVIQDLEEDGFRVLLLHQNISFFKVETLTLHVPWECRHSQASLLSALKRNYILQHVHCICGGDDFFTFNNPSRLEWYLNRNRKLAQWTANPDMVPRYLWQYALNLAQKAGNNSLYQSLLALSGKSIGLRQQTRKRKGQGKGKGKHKDLQYYKPESP